MFIKEEDRKYKTLKEIENEYKGYWVLVTDLNMDTEIFDILGGKVVAYSDNREELRKYPTKGRYVTRVYTEEELKKERGVITLGSIDIVDRGDSND